MSTLDIFLYRAVYFTALILALEVLRLFFRIYRNTKRILGDVALILEIVTKLKPTEPPAEVRLEFYKKIAGRLERVMGLEIVKAGESLDVEVKAVKDSFENPSKVENHAWSMTDDTMGTIEGAGAEATFVSNGKASPAAGGEASRPDRCAARGSRP